MAKSASIGLGTQPKRDRLNGDRQRPASGPLSKSGLHRADSLARNPDFNKANPVVHSSVTGRARRSGAGGEPNNYIDAPHPAGRMYMGTEGKLAHCYSATVTVLNLVSLL